jgi:hypothetical protein
MTPFAGLGRMVIGSMPMQMCTSGHSPIVSGDLYSNPYMRVPRSMQVRHASLGASRPTQSRQSAFWQIAQMPTAGLLACV